MVEILFLLLPIAFYSGWRAAKKHFFAQQEQQCRLSDSYVKGVNFLLNEQPDKALEVFLNYPDIDQYTAETYQLLGNLFRNRGEVDRALKVHQNLIARSNLKPVQKEIAMFSLGEDFFAAGMLDRAESVFQEMLNNFQSRNKVGKGAICCSLRTIYEQTQEWQKAIDATDCIKKHGVKDSEGPRINNDALIAHYYCELADQSLRQGNLHEVDALLKKASSADKKSTRLMVLQGDVAFHQKQYSQALKKYLKPVRQDSRLLTMLIDKLEMAAKSSGEIQLLQNELLKFYKKKADKSLFEVIVKLALRYDTTKAIDDLIISELTNRKLNIESVFEASEYVIEKKGSIDCDQGLVVMNQALANYLKGLAKFSCQHCGYKMHDYLWRCPACHHWDTIDHA